MSFFARALGRNHLAPAPISLTIVNGDAIQSLFLPMNAAALRTFALHCISELSVENPIGYAAMLGFRESPSEAKALYIWQRFIDRSADLEVNIKSDAKQQIQLAMQRAPGGRQRTPRVHAVPRDMFSKAMRDVEGNMADSYARWPVVREDSTGRYYATAMPLNDVGPARTAIAALARSGFNVPRGLMGL